MTTTHLYEKRHGANGVRTSHEKAGSNREGQKEQKVLYGDHPSSAKLALTGGISALLNYYDDDELNAKVGNGDSKGKVKRSEKYEGVERGGTESSVGAELDAISESFVDGDEVWVLQNDFASRMTADRDGIPALYYLPKFLSQSDVARESALCL
ncbi:hypothetical protein SCHPADRAFT_890618 [Schizopora paradoxa]|uniref:Uncharacterized protein n=1 Tax=Schizopora paradoxa TaxID=27342 RepID=A0A0H2RT80_9AGAM|nr:hypothetical protein SCHPADRAFT_890618 [Schizopora paradoxa]